MHWQHFNQEGECAHNNVMFFIMPMQKLGWGHGIQPNKMASVLGFQYVVTVCTGVLRTIPQTGCIP